jgi:hypothetical protein
MEAAGIEPAQDFNRLVCFPGEDTLAWASVRECHMKAPTGERRLPRLLL